MRRAEGPPLAPSGLARWVAREPRHVPTTRSAGRAHRRLIGQPRARGVSGRWGQVYLLGERHWVHKRFHQDVTAADYDAGFTQSTTP